ncbi:hypothetical protein HOLleu_27412 [Holothuria leucospilota]|uniref:Uncharacterized protein n=1 Tax=Holothuria leucospilota TaxID=206669 RepID=A0A9Q1BQ93_HOLLE|nr:hypothetical protein HOLleu_27412 [Holothuria leucospilota]
MESIAHSVFLALFHSLIAPSDKSQFTPYYYYGGDSGDRARSHFVLSIILCILFFGQGVISIIGASFTCGALRGNGSAATHTVTHQHAQPSIVINEPAPPYFTVVTSPTAPASDMPNNG